MSLNETNKMSIRETEFSDQVEATVTFSGKTQRIQWRKEMSLLDAMLNAGIDAPYSCCSGKCGTCVCKLQAGEVRLKRNFVLSETHLQQGLILACVAAPVSDSIHITYDNF